MAVGLRQRVGGAPAAGTEGAQELQQDGERVRLRVRRDRPHDVTCEPVEGVGVERDVDGVGRRLEQPRYRRTKRLNE